MLTVSQMSHLCDIICTPAGLSAPEGKGSCLLFTLHPQQPGDFSRPTWIQGEHYLPFQKKPALGSCMGPAPRVAEGSSLFSALGVACVVYSLWVELDPARNSFCTCRQRSTHWVTSLRSMCPEAHTHNIPKQWCSVNKTQVPGKTEGWLLSTPPHLSSPHFSSMGTIIEPNSWGCFRD